MLTHARTAERFGDNAFFFIGRQVDPDFLFRGGQRSQKIRKQFLPLFSYLILAHFIGPHIHNQVKLEWIVRMELDSLNKRHVKFAAHLHHTPSGRQERHLGITCGRGRHIKGKEEEYDTGNCT
ncbi:MAG: hypothetical protein HY591_06590 [Candidatus Omnitrophica bacterium]|nr:hypothetical protein [Candidatus Omnitrophota bacterium]